MGRKKLWLIVFVLLFAASGILSACSSKGANSSDEKVDLDKKVKLTWMAILYHQQPPKNSVLKEIEKLTNTELDITWVPDAVKEDRLNSALAAGNLPQIVTIQDIKNSSAINAFRSGMFWEVGPYLNCLLYTSPSPRDS